MARCMNKNIHVRCRTWEKIETVSNFYLLLCNVRRFYFEHKREQRDIQFNEPERTVFPVNVFSNVQFVENPPSEFGLPMIPSSYPECNSIEISFGTKKKEKVKKS